MRGTPYSHSQDWLAVVSTIARATLALTRFQSAKIEMSAHTLKVSTASVTTVTLTSEFLDHIHPCASALDMTDLGT